MRMQILLCLHPSIQSTKSKKMWHIGLQILLQALKPNRDNIAIFCVIWNFFYCEIYITSCRLCLCNCILRLHGAIYKNMYIISFIVSYFIIAVLVKMWFMITDVLSADWPHTVWSAPWMSRWLLRFVTNTHSRQVSTDELWPARSDSCIVCCVLKLNWISSKFITLIWWTGAFSALTLLVGRQEGIRPVKNWVVGCWRGYLSGVRCRLAYGPADATATHCLLL